MADTADGFDLFLASASPRRRELLAQLGLRVRQLVVGVDETPRPDEDPAAYVQRLAHAKASAGLAQRPAGVQLPVLGADTAVVIDGRILGKPAGREQALEMLGLLSGRVHEVLSAVAVGKEAVEVRLNRSRVRFRSLSDAERQAYWETGEPADKAGAYAIQGLGALFVTELHGSYSGVMGLPLYETAELLRRAGIPLLES